MTFDEWLHKKEWSRGPSTVLLEEVWDAAVAEQKARDAKIAKHIKPQGNVVISWGMQETRPCDCPLVIAAAIRKQP